MSGILIVRVNCASRAEARAIAEAAIAQHLAAAANIQGPVDSLYRWQGEVASAREFTLDLKTTDRLFEPVAAMIRKLHGYDTPSILALAPAVADPAYAAWIDEATSPAGR